MAIKENIFSRAELLMLDQAWHLAGSLVADDFRLNFDDFRSWPVDVKPFAELAPEEKAPGVFAQLLRYLRPGPVVVGGRPDYYRICLYDPTILAAVRQEPGLGRAPLLTYVLTHEFIHVARFTRFLEIFELDDQARATEEEIVHRDTFRLLRPVSLPGLPLVLDLYKTHRLPVD